ncbi:MAG TPA: zinc ribbon domain-containing protein [Blastocatellia bacterium]|nr:zinc ribbon domain-containing protein [Blastocatellia bacterium]
MFCPSCGTLAQPTQRFCKNCGTDLGVVSSALASRDNQGVNTDQTQSGQPVDLTSLNKQMARGYKDAVTGAGILLAIFVVIVLMHERWAIWVVLWLLIWGCSSLAKGIGNILAARHTTASLSSQPQISSPRTTARVQTNPIPPYQPPAARTDPSGFHPPESVTEQTTRKLENIDSTVEH